MDQIIQLFREDAGRMIAVVAIVGGISLSAISIVTGAVVQIAKTGARERSRRELAAYVAEGTISPEMAERMLEAGRKPSAAKKASGWC